MLALIAVCSAAFGWDVIRQAAFPTNFYTLEKIGSTIWAGGYVGGVAKSTDDGLTWTFVQTPAYTPPTYKDVWDIDFINQNQGIMVGDDGMVAVTTDGGNTWNIPATVTAIIGTTRMLGVVYHEDGKVWACGYSGMIIYSPDFGVTWQRQGVGVTVEIGYGMTMNEDGLGFVALNNGNPDQSKIYKTSDYGTTWALVNLTITGNPTLYKVRQFGSKVVICGDSGYIGYSNDNGTTWTHYPNAAGTTTSDAMRDVVMNGDIGYAVGRNSRLLKTTDGWATYETVTNDFSVYFEGIKFRNDGSLLACGWQGALAMSQDSGTHWNEIVPTAVDIWKANIIDANTWYLVGDKGSIMKTTDGGATLLKKNVFGDVSAFYASHFKNANEGFVSGKTSGKIFRTLDGGDSWTNITIPGFSSARAYYEFFFLNNMVGYLVGVGSKIVKTTDGGDTWNLVGDNIGSTTNLYCTYWKDENNGYAGSTTGRIFITIDGGVTWNPITVGSSAYINDIWFKDANNGVVVNSMGQIFYTTTGGNTVDSWIAASEQALDDVYGVTCDYNGVYWAAGYSSDDTSSNIGNSWAILKSLDNGATWTQESFPALLPYNATRFTGITVGEGTMVAYGKNNLIVAKSEIVEHVTLNAPANLTTDLDPANVTLSWTPSPDGAVAQVYQIFVSTNPEALFDELYFETTQTSFDLSAVANLGYSTRWYWAVLPVSGFFTVPNIGSPNFMKWQFTTMADPNIVVLDAPVLSIEKVEGQVRLAWPAVTNAGYYRVLGATSPDGEYDEITTTTNTEYLVIAPAGRGFYRVIAYTDPARK